MTSVGLQHTVTSQHSSSGIPRLDTLLGGKGFYRGSSVLISGTKNKKKKRRKKKKEQKKRKKQKKD